MQNQVVSDSSSKYSYHTVCCFSAATNNSYTTALHLIFIILFGVTSLGQSRFRKIKFKAYNRMDRTWQKKKDHHNQFNIKTIPKPFTYGDNA